MHRVHAPGAAPPAIEVSPAESHHMTRVLRLGPGDEVEVFDGRGRSWLGRIALAGSHVTVEIVAAREPVAEPSVIVTMGVGLLKGDQMDGVVRDSTMLGAAVIAPFVSTHVVAPERARQTRAIERWERVAVASAKQCGRAVVPEIQPIADFAALVAAHAADRIVMCVEPSRAAVAPADGGPPPARALVLVGPEGGWTDAELDVAAGAGALLMSLGPRTLRAEAAPTVALSALWTMWGWTREGQRAEGKGQREGEKG